MCRLEKFFKNLLYFSGSEKQKFVWNVIKFERKKAKKILFQSLLNFFGKKISLKKHWWLSFVNKKSSIWFLKKLWKSIFFTCSAFIKNQKKHSDSRLSNYQTFSTKSGSLEHSFRRTHMHTHGYVIEYYLAAILLCCIFFISAEGRRKIKNPCSAKIIIA